FFPPRWSRGNPVDPAGDRNFIAYMQAPELLLKLPEVDSMVYMGFDSFSSFSSFFTTLSADLAKGLGEYVEEFSRMIPEETEGDPGQGREWMGRLVAKIAGVFFSYFGTSTPAEVEAFAHTQGTFLKSEKISSDLEKKLRDVLRPAEAESLENIGELFAEIFQPLMEALVLRWIEVYKKPVITTSFLGTAPAVSDMGHYPYPFAEQAAYVLAKMVEYRDYLDRAKEDPAGES
ncbi:MAG: hypothetical protein SV487_04465, partial [Thermodesulfobacteriota bacterium]|nr:hypothetical protein [Thermodesulfobacteriota bacterium]